MKGLVYIGCHLLLIISFVVMWFTDGLLQNLTVITVTTCAFVLAYVKMQYIGAAYFAEKHGVKLNSRLSILGPGKINVFFTIFTPIALIASNIWLFFQYSVTFNRIVCVSNIIVFVLFCIILFKVASK